MFNVITLIGSTKFKKEFCEVQKSLTLAGNIVIPPGLFGHAGDKEAFEVSDMLNDMVRQKIDMAHTVYVVDVDGYIGESTKAEIEYAKNNEKIIRYYSKPTSSFGPLPCPICGKEHYVERIKEENGEYFRCGNTEFQNGKQLNEWLKNEREKRRNENG